MDQEDRELIAKYFRAKLANPDLANRERIGCPDPSVLVQLAEGRLSAASEWYDHLTICRACWDEAEALRLQHRDDTRRSRNRRWVVGLVATAACLAILTAIWQWPKPTQPPIHAQKGSPPRIETKEPVPQERDRITPTPSKPESNTAVTTMASATLDLTAFTVPRGGENPSQPSLSLRSVRQNLRVILPPVSEAGTYRARLLDKDLNVVWETTGVAELKKGRAILGLVLNVGIAPGTYQMALQRQGEEWRLYPVEVSQ